MAKSSASYTTSVPGVTGYDTARSGRLSVPGVTGYDTARSGRLYMAQWVQPLANGQRKHCKKRGFTTIRDAAAYKRKMEEANDRGVGIDPAASRITISQLSEEWLDMRKSVVKTRTWESEEKRKMEEANDRGVGIDPAASRITISQLSEEWLDMRKSVVKTRTWESEESHHRVHIVPYWGDTTIGSIRFSAIQAWVAELTGEGLAPKTVHNVYADFAALIRYALRDRLITVNPCDGIKLPKIPPREMVCLTPEELGRLADASGYYKPYILTLGTCGLRDGEARYYKPYILTLGTCGLRDGEARALRVRNIDFDKRRIAVESTFERTNTEGWIENPPKTWERRDVAVPAVTIDALRELCADKAPDDFVFRQPNGEMMPQQKRGRRRTGRHDRRATRTLRRQSTRRLRVPPTKRRDDAPTKASARRKEGRSLPMVRARDRGQRRTLTAHTRSTPHDGIHRHLRRCQRESGAETLRPQGRERDAQHICVPVRARSG